MRLLPRLEDEQKSGAITIKLFRSHSLAYSQTNFRFQSEGTKIFELRALSALTLYLDFAHMLEHHFERSVGLPLRP